MHMSPYNHYFLVQRRCVDYTCTVLLAATKSRTLEPLAVDEYCRFDTPAFF
jgi:hypothetical protein